MFKRKNRLTKEEYWHKWEFFELLEHLHVCDELMNAEFGEEKYDETEIGELHAQLMEAIDNIEFGNRNDLMEVHELFIHSNLLSEYIKERNQDLIDRIIEITSNWKVNNC